MYLVSASLFGESLLIRTVAHRQGCEHRIRSWQAPRGTRQGPEHACIMATRHAIGVACYLEIRAQRAPASGELQQVMQGGLR